MAYGGTQETEGIMRKGNRAWIAGLAIVLALGMWHLNDVRSGAVQSGDGWLVDRYLLLLAMVLAVTVTLAFFLSGKTVANPGRIRDNIGTNNGKIQFIRRKGELPLCRN